MKKRIRYIFLLILLTLIGAYFYTPYLIVETKNPFIELIRKKGVSTQTLTEDLQENVSIIHDGLTLTGVLTKSNTDTTKATIILVHGIRSRKEWWHTKSLLLADSSYQTLAIDLRAHGESEGKYSTFGVKEKEDITAWIDYLYRNEELKNTKLGIWGQSLGGAVSLQAIANEDRLDFGIIESTFHDFEVVATDYGQDFIGFRSRVLTKHFLSKAGTLADFAIEDARPIDACKKIKQPILFIHGSEDEKIKLTYNQENFEVIPHSDKEFYIVERAGHYNVWNVGGQEYRVKVYNFIKTLN